MPRLRLIQAGLAICLMASLLTASPAACVCSHHEETITSDEFHSHHEEAENIEVSHVGISIDDSCRCAVDQRSPYVASKSESKELRSKSGIADAQQLIPDLEFVAVSSFQRSSPEFTNDLSYSSTLRSLLPSRAPPRL